MSMTKEAWREAMLAALLEIVERLPEGALRPGWNLQPDTRPWWEQSDRLSLGDRAMVAYDGWRGRTSGTMIWAKHESCQDPGWVWESDPQSCLDSGRIIDAGRLDLMDTDEPHRDVEKAQAIVAAIQDLAMTTGMSHRLAEESMLRVLRLPADDEVVVKRRDVELVAVPREHSKAEFDDFRAAQKRMRAALQGDD